MNNEQLRITSYELTMRYTALQIANSQ